MLIIIPNLSLVIEQYLDVNFHLVRPQGLKAPHTASTLKEGAVWRNFQLGFKDTKVSPDGRPDGIERTSSTSVLKEISDILSNTRGKSIGSFESSGTPELSSTFAMMVTMKMVLHKEVYHLKRMLRMKKEDVLPQITPSPDHVSQSQPTMI